MLLPFHCYFIAFDEPSDEEFEFIDEWGFGLSDDERGEVAVVPEAPMDQIRAASGYSRDTAAWAFTEPKLREAGVAFLDRYRTPGVRLVTCPRGRAMVATDRASALEALGESYLPVHLLLLLTKETGDLQRLARAALAGDESVLPILADALEEAGHPCAGSARRLFSASPDAIPLDERPEAFGLLPDGSAVCLRRSDGAVELLSLEDGRRLAHHPLDPEGMGVISPCGRCFGLVHGQAIAVRRIVPWSMCWRIETDAVAASFGWSADGSLSVALFDEGHRVVAWEAATGEEVGNIDFPRGETLIGFTRDGVARISSGRLAVRSLRDGSESHLPLPDNPASSVVSPDGTKVVSGDHEGARLIGFTPDGSRYFTLDEMGISSWDAATEAKRGTHRIEGGLGAFAFSADGRTVAHWDGMAIRWSQPGEGPEPVVVDVGSPIQAVSVTPTGTVVISRADELSGWTHEGASLGDARSEPVAAQSCLMDETTQAEGGWGEVVLRRLPTREILKRLPAGEGEVSCVAFAGGTLAAGGWDRKLRIWRL